MGSAVYPVENFPLDIYPESIFIEAVYGYRDGWTPLNLSIAPETWYEARLQTVVADGTAVQPIDLSGNSHTSLQATGAKRPLYKTNILNGHPSYRYDGVNDATQALFPLVQPYTRIQLLRSTNVSAVPAYFCDGNANNKGAVIWNRASVNNLQLNANEAALGSTFDFSTFNWIVAVFDGTDSTARINNVNHPLSISAPFAANAGGTTLGAAADMIQVFAAMDLMLHIDVPGVLAEEDYTQLAEYILDNYDM